MRSEVGANGPGKLGRNAWGRLVLTDEESGESVEVEPVRAFPITAPRRGISLCDTEGREVLWIDNLDDLAPDLCRMLEEELSRREFVPELSRILSISTAVEPSEWQVETDRGRARFLLKSEDDVHSLDEHRAMVTDAHGIRYLIPDLRRLDATSRRLLERFL